MAKKLYYISNETVQKLLTISEALTVIDEVYRDHGEGSTFLSAPSSLGLNTPEPKVKFKIKGAYVASQRVAGFRLIGFSQEPPRGVCYLCDPETSLPFALVDERWQYLVRSGLTAVVTARHLARRDSNVLAMLGCGGIAPFALTGFRDCFPLQQVSVHSKRRESRARFAREMKEKLGLNVRAVDTPQEAVANADIIVTLTNADEPLIRPEWVKSGAFVCSLGEAQELDDRFLDWADRLIIDDFDFCTVLGDIAAWIRKGLRGKDEILKKVSAGIGEIAAGKKPGRTNPSENIVAIIQGMASSDIALANYVFKKALQEGMAAEWPV
jgi:alanine dehydrogenase